MLILSIIAVLIFACIPSFLWLCFFLREDLHPEPKRLVVYTFSAGALVSLFVLVCQYIFQGLLTNVYQNIVLSVVGFALIEEIFKFYAAYWSVKKDPAFDEPVDAMIYMIAAALGFASVENLFVLANSIPQLSELSFGVTISTFLLRFIGATLLHTLSSAFVGFYWGKSKLRAPKHAKITIGIIVATLVHFVFNYMVLHFQNNNLLIYPSLFLITATFFVLLDFEKLKEHIEKKKQV